MDTSDSEVDAAAAALAVLLVRRRRRRQRRFGIHEVLQKRKSLGQYHAIIAMLKRDDAKFKQYTRMTIPAFGKLLGKVKRRIQKFSRREAIGPEERLIVTLRYLSQGDSFVSIGTSFCMGANTVGRIVRETCQAIVDELSPDYFSLPSTPEEWEVVANDFWQRWNIPNTCGAIDGKHIRIKAPANSGTLFHNYKGFFSTVMMAVADARCRILYASFGSYGHENDSGVFDRSDFGQMVKADNNLLNLPPPSRLPGSEDICPYFFVGDAAFPLRSNIQKPFSQRGMTHEKTVFNYRISRARRVVESTFGILAQRWRVLLRPIETTPEFCDVIVKALACLHNFLLEEGLVQPPPPTANDGVDEDHANEQLPQAVLRNPRANRTPRDGEEVRDVLVRFFNGPGAVEWQNAVLGL